MIPSNVTSASQPAASKAPTRIARSACSEPSLQIRKCILPVSMTCEQSVNHYNGADHRERDKSHPDARPGKVLGQSGAHLRPDGGARMHHQGNQDVHIALQRMTH